MRLDPDCIRDILISVEAMDYGSMYTIAKLHEKLPTYSEDKLQYHCIQLLDGKLLNAKTINVMGCTTPQVWRILDLTYQGHQFLADIRSDTTWNRTKEIAKNIGSESIHALTDIAVGVITSAIQGKLGL